MIYIIFIICIALAAYSALSLQKAKQLEKEKIEYDDELQKYENKLTTIQKNIAELSQQHKRLVNEIIQQREEFDNAYERESEKFAQQVQMLQNNANAASDNYIMTLEDAYEKAEQSFDLKIEKLKQEENKCNEELQKVKNSLIAATEAKLREQEKKKQIEFFKLPLPEGGKLADLNKLIALKKEFNEPEIISKLIWTLFFQKATNDLCTRIVGTAATSGIYKITNLETEQCYIGRSIDIAERWKQHIKCGLGIDASTTNKLYNDMQKYGVWNYSFEILEKCSKDDIKEKEAYWIDMYQSDKYGLNGQKGDSK